jgi:hypothetical protein
MGKRVPGWRNLRARRATIGVMHLVARPSRFAPALILLLVTLQGASILGAAPIVTIAGSDGTTAPDWVAIKADTYDQRLHFEAGAARLSAKLNDEIGILKAKRAGMTTDLKDWDFAMKDVDVARALLTSRMTELSQATTPETWIDARDKFGEAWKSSQLAVDKMNSTVTS